MTNYAAEPTMLTWTEAVLNAEQQRHLAVDALGALISPEYVAEQVRLHECGYYGAYSDKWAPFVGALAAALHVESILDYGCGQGKLGRELRAVGLTVRDYDPAIPEVAFLPEPADLVFCSDVLEHVEPDRLSAVLAHLASVTRRVLCVVIATRPATRWLSDGRNAHLIIESDRWWRNRFLKRGWRPHAIPVRPMMHEPALELFELWRPPAVHA